LNTVINPGSIKGGKFLDQLSEYQLLKEEDCVAWRLLMWYVQSYIMWWATQKFSHRLEPHNTMVRPCGNEVLKYHLVASTAISSTLRDAAIRRGLAQVLLLDPY
jgi:hypothetical protein